MMMMIMMTMIIMIMIGNRQLAEAHRFAQEMESTNEESDRRTQSTIAQLKEKYMSAMTPLEARLRMETDTVKMLHAKIRYAMVLMMMMMIMMIAIGSDSDKMILLVILYKM
jgi:hypothetical protein